jgi:O-antigen ligase
MPNRSNGSGSGNGAQPAESPSLLRPLTIKQIHPLDLDPSQLERRLYTTRRRRHLLDAGSVLCITAGMAMLIPYNLVLPGLAGIGRPVMVMGLVMAGWWFVARLHPRLVIQAPQPLRWAAAAFLAALLASYAAGFLRGLPAIEANAADRSMIMYVVVIGVALACADGLPNRGRLDDLLRVLIGLGTVMALIGHLQFVLGINLVEYIRLPGLVDHQETVGYRERGEGFFQVASTAAHYIEFSTVMALLVPIGIHLWRFGRTPLSRQLAAVCTLLIAAAIPVTLSRTGFVGMAVAGLVLAFFWSWRVRFNAAVLVCGMTAALMLVVPGLLGTLQYMFLEAADDPSVQGRTEDYDPAMAYVRERPWFGRGVGTFIPTLYRFIDNDWLIHLITIGWVGTIAYAVWHLTAISLAWAAYRRTSRAEDRHLCACLIAIQFSAMVMAFFFDAMAFTTHTTVLALLTGASGAMWRFTHPSRQVRSAASRLTTTRTPRLADARGVGQS